MEVISTTTLGERQPWQDLPPDLLGLVLQRVPSHADRLHVRAVCRSWHAGAGVWPSLLPLLPLLVQQDGTFLSLPDGVVHQIAAPDDVFLQKSTGGMFFLVHNDGRCSLLNPFSRETAPQYVSAECFRCEFNNHIVVYNITKAVVMPDHIITIDYKSDVSIQWRTMDIRWTHTLDLGAYALDVTLFQEKLYVLVRTYTGGNKLYVLNIINDKHVNLPCILSAPIDGMAPRFFDDINHYLVASGDRLLMVKQKVFEAKFEVFEEVDLSNGGARWREVDTLLGRALFVSKGYSQSLLAGDPSFGPQEDCIYFLHELIDKSVSLCSGIYDMRNGTLSPLPSEAVVAQDGPVTASWLFPPNT